MKGRVSLAELRRARLGAQVRCDDGADRRMRSMSVYPAVRRPPAALAYTAAQHESCPALSFYVAEVGPRRRLARPDYRFSCSTAQSCAIAIAAGEAANALAAERVLRHSSNRQLERAPDDRRGDLCEVLEEA